MLCSFNSYCKNFIISFLHITNEYVLYKFCYYSLYKELEYSRFPGVTFVSRTKIYEALDVFYKEPKNPLKRDLTSFNYFVTPHHTVVIP